MKKISKIIVVLFIVNCSLTISNAQNTAITDDSGYSPNSSAMLDVKSTDKGILVPRLSTVQRTAVSSPATGLLVFDTDENNFYFYNGISWINLSSANANNILGYSATDKVYLKDVNNNFGIGTTTPTNKLEVKADADNGLDQAIFNVVNNDGDTVFAVYPQGVRINVYDDPLAKAVSKKGGFAVGGFKPAKGTITNEYLRITPDSIRMYIEEGDVTKAASKKGGFAVGGFKPAKATAPTDYFNIFGASSADVLFPSESRIFWYPVKEAFLTGRVIVESPDSVGTNSFSTGNESKAIGDFSQALGDHSRAFGKNSTAIGYYANAIAQNSFALGNEAIASDTASYAIGTGAIASGMRSFAIGSRGVDAFGFTVGSTTASGNYSYAFGMGAEATSTGAFAFGTKTKASGQFSTAIGYNTKAMENMSLAMGNGSTASGSVSTAFGDMTIASGQSSTAMGTSSIASGYASVALGNNAEASNSNAFASGSNTNASGNSSTAMGEITTASGSISTALGYSTTASGMISFATGSSTRAEGYASTAMGDAIIAQADRTFGIGLDNPFPSSWTISQANTMAIMGGKVGIGTVSPDKTLHVAGDARIEGDIYYGIGINVYSKPDFVFKSNYSKKYDIFEIEKFIQKNNHLPWVTSAENETTEGVNITRMTFETLESVENLQLQIIDLKKENEILKSEIQEIKRLIETIK